mgnify:FL=1
MLLKANHNLVLPDGKTEIKVGETFEYKGDIAQFGSCVTVIGDEGERDPEVVALKPLSEMTEKEIRAEGKKRKIASSHNKNIDDLKAAIQKLREEENAPKDPESKEDPEKAPTNEGEKETAGGENENAGE